MRMFSSFNHFVFYGVCLMCMCVCVCVVICARVVWHAVYNLECLVSALMQTSRILLTLSWFRTLINVRISTCKDI